ncbi:hypothetical protein R6Q59_034987 [Mikania micrantha]
MYQYQFQIYHLSQDVTTALTNWKRVVALESPIISCGYSLTFFVHRDWCCHKYPNSTIALGERN